MKLGAHVIVVSGEHAGKKGIVAKETKDGRVRVNFFARGFSPGLAMNAFVRKNQIRRVRVTKGAI